MNFYLQDYRIETCGIHEFFIFKVKKFHLKPKKNPNLNSVQKELFFGAGRGLYIYLTRLNSEILSKPLQNDSFK